MFKSIPYVAINDKVAFLATEGFTMDGMGMVAR
jgi:hypothetical protein